MIARFIFMQIVDAPPFNRKIRIFRSTNALSKRRYDRFAIVLKTTLMILVNSALSTVTLLFIVNDPWYLVRVSQLHARSVLGNRLQNPFRSSHHKECEMPDPKQSQIKPNSICLNNVDQK